jgi:hypothetical protein
MAVLVLFLFVVILPPTGWVYFCNKCGSKFRRPALPGSSGKWAVILLAMACGFVVVLGLGLCVWALETKYWSIVAVGAALLAGRFIARGMSRLDNEQE